MHVGKAAICSSVSAFDALMINARQKALPSIIVAGNRKDGLKGNEVLFNDEVGYLGLLGVGWSRDIVDSIGKRFVTSLCDALWYRDAHHDKLADRGIYFPKRLSHFKYYND